MAFACSDFVCAVLTLGLQYKVTFLDGYICVKHSGSINLKMRVN